MIAQPTPSANRRVLLAGLTLALMPQRLLAAPADRSLRFAVFRNGSHVGEHQMDFERSGDLTTATTSVAMLIRLGPVPVFRYSHHAREIWRSGRFDRLETSTTSNGKREQVSASAAPDAVVITTLAGATSAAATAAPLTHWNPQAFAGPLFNPQTGKPLNVTVRRNVGERLPDRSDAAIHWAVRGETEIDDWYDGRGSWAALRGRLPDRSLMEYRRL